MKRALISILTAVGVVLVSVLGACGVAASTSNSGPTVVTRIDGYTIYKFCDDSRLVYFTSNGGIAIGTGGTC